MSKLKHFFHSTLIFIQKRRILSSIILVVVIALITTSVLVSGSRTPKTTSLTSGDLVRSVKISGKVVPKEKVDLGFEIPGTVSSVPKKVGDKVYQGEVVVSLASGGIRADLGKAEAQLASAKAELAKLDGTQSYENSITSAKRSLTQAILNSYMTASDSVLAKADQVLYIPSKFNDAILKGEILGSVDLKDSIQKGRIEIGNDLDKWHDLVSGLNATSIYTQTQLDVSKQYLNSVTAFVNDVAKAVGLFEENNYMTQSEIDAYKSVLSNAQDNLNATSQKLIDKENNLASLLASVPVQVAAVEAAQASVDNLRFQLGKTSLISPITGIIAKQGAKSGQAVSGGVSITSVISPTYILEAYIPEKSVIGVRVGNVAKVNLDAYKKATFDAKVNMIDPAETIRDGVSTYKVELGFVNPTEDIRSGMTADIEIETFRKSSVNMLPDRAVVKQNNETYVYVLESGEVQKRAVEIGETDSKGNVEILSGISTADLVIVNPEEID